MDRYFIYKHFMDWHMDKHIFHFQFFFVEIIDFTILLISGVSVLIAPSPLISVYASALN